MTTTRTVAMMAALCTGLMAQVAPAQNVRYVTENGVKYQVTEQVVKHQVPVTVMQDRQQTVYAQQVTTNNYTHQQLYTVPVTQYQWQSELRGRWNPFITPYWTHNLRPVTTWHQQVANVQIPVNNVAWVPQTKTVQVPVTEYRTAEKTITTRVAMDEPRKLATAQPIPGRAVTIASRPNPTVIGGQKLENDPPKQATGNWNSDTGSRYR